MPAHGGMPGMLSERELNALREAAGVDARLFLTQMIAHHEGASSKDCDEQLSREHFISDDLLRSISVDGKVIAVEDEPVGESDFFGGELELMGMPAGFGKIFAFGSARVIIGAS